MSDHPLSWLRTYTYLVAERGLKPNDRHVAATIASFANKEGACWPSDTTIAAITGLSPRTIPAVRQRLRTAGVLDWVQHGAPNGKANRYRLNLDPPELVDKAPSSRAIAREVDADHAHPLRAFGAPTSRVEGDDFARNGARQRDSEGTREGTIPGLRENAHRRGVEQPSPMPDDLKEWRDSQRDRHHQRERPAR